MTGMILVDTDVLVDFLRGRPEAVAYVKEQFESVVLSAVTVAELYAGVKGAAEEDRLNELMRIFPILPVDAEVARLGGALRSRFGPSHGICLADALIAGTALTHQAELKTLNTKHFPMFEGLTAAYRKE